jgi:hypothetical protein
LYTKPDTGALNENAEHIVTKDSAGNMLTGEKNYRMHLPPDIPSCNFWSVIVYDSQTRLMIKTEQLWPSVYSSRRKLLVNHDGSVDVFFGPQAHVPADNNWIMTIPMRSWYSILRIYDPIEPLSDKIWKHGEIEEIVY